MTDGLPRDIATTLPQLTAFAASKWGDRTAWLFDETGERLSFAEIESDSASIAARLQAEGVAPGDRVGVMLRNCPAFPLVWLAICRLGAAMVPLNVNYKVADAGYILGHATPKVVVSAPEFVDVISAASDGMDQRPSVLRADLRALDLRDRGRAQADLDPHVLANVQYTSGTTGHPKGCMLSHGYWLALAERMRREMIDLDEADVMMTAQPFYYMDPQWNVVVALLTGARLVVLDGFHPSSFWSKVRAHGVTFFYCLGAMPTLLLKMPPHPDDRAHRVRKVLCSAIPPSQHQTLQDRWGVPWQEAFGMTETGGDLAVFDSERDQLVGSGSIGRPLAGREARVVDDAGMDVSPGTTGELLLRGDWMMQGYFRDAQATQRMFRDGWFHTGDIVQQDEQGRFYYVSRKKEMIRRGGENISAAEVEDVIQSHPDVASAACLPEPDDIRGEEVKAIIILKDDASIGKADPQPLIAHCEARLARFKVPRFWSFRVDDFPRTPSERVEKHKLATQLAENDGPIFDRSSNAWSTLGPSNN